MQVISLPEVYQTANQTSNTTYWHSHTKVDNIIFLPSKPLLSQAWVHCNSFILFGDKFSWLTCLLRNSIYQEEWLKKRSGWLFRFSLSHSHTNTHTHLPHCPVWSAPPLLVAPGQCATVPVESERHRWRMWDSWSWNNYTNMTNKSRHLERHVFL